MAVVPSAFAENELSYVNPYKYGAIVKELGTFRTFYFNKYRKVAGNYHFIIKMNKRQTARNCKAGEFRYFY